jgi:hypothetical protein
MLYTFIHETNHLKSIARAKYLGIWMDHLNAHLMEFTTDPIQTKTITSQFTQEQKENSLGNYLKIHKH